jgi:hypothetical protein
MMGGVFVREAHGLVAPLHHLAVMGVVILNRVLRNRLKA